MNRIAVALVLLLTAAPAAAQVSFVDRAVTAGQFPETIIHNKEVFL